MIKKTLIEVLSQKQESEDLIKTISNLKSIVMPILEEIQELFPEFPKHGLSHSEKVEKILNIIVPDNLKQEMNKYENFFFTMCCLFA